MGSSGSRLEYKTLQGSQIRLLQFKDNSSATENIQLRLKHYDTAKSIPPYIALSYVWGSYSKDRAIKVNNRLVPVTDNLYDALKHIRDVLTNFRTGIAEATQKDQGAPLFWIDAICINQEDLDEKSREVPKMTQIYSKAFTVLVWLGTIQSLEAEPAGFNFLLTVLDMVVPVADFQKPQLELHHNSRPAMSDDTAADHLKIYARILMNDWFKRVWVLQEYCLSQRQPTVLLGHAMLSFQALYGYAPNLEQVANNPDPEIRNKLGSLANLVQSLAKVSFGPTYMPEHFSSFDFRQRSTAQRLLWILMNLGSKVSTVPHDQIYGVLGLIGMDALPSELRPNYSLPYQSVCRSYSRYLIEETKDLRFLMFSNPPLLEEEPSWVVDFRTISPWALEPQVAHTGHFTKDGKGLVVEGVKTGHLLQVIPRNVGDINHQIASIRQFHNIALVASAKIKRLPLERIWRQWFTEFLRYTCGQTEGALATADEYSTLEDFLDTVHANANERIDEIDRHWVLSTFGGHDYVLIDDGTVARCMLRKFLNDSGLQYEVWSLKGTMQRYVIARDDRNQHRYAGWVTESAVEEFNHDFFSRHQVKQCTLV